MSDPRVPVLRQRLEVTSDLGRRRRDPTHRPSSSIDDAGRRPSSTSRSATAWRPTAPSGPGTRAALNVPVARAHRPDAGQSRARRAGCCTRSRASSCWSTSPASSVSYFRERRAGLDFEGRRRHATTARRRCSDRRSPTSCSTRPGRSRPGFSSRTSCRRCKRDPGYLAAHRTSACSIGSGREVDP